MVQADKAEERRRAILRLSSVACSHRTPQTMRDRSQNRARLDVHFARKVLTSYKPLLGRTFDTHMQRHTHTRVYIIHARITTPHLGDMVASVFCQFQFISGLPVTWVLNCIKLHCCKQSMHLLIANACRPWPRWLHRFFCGGCWKNLARHWTADRASHPKCLGSAWALGELIPFLKFTELNIYIYIYALSCYGSPS